MYALTALKQNEGVRMEIFYVTLCRELSGFCIRAVAQDEVALRFYLAATYGKLWCSVYTKKPPETVIGALLCVEQEGAE